MIIFAYDHRAIIMTDTVPCGIYIIVTSSKSCAEKCTKVDLVVQSQATHSPWQCLLTYLENILTEKLCEVGLQCCLMLLIIQIEVHQTSSYSRRWMNPCVDVYCGGDFCLRYLSWSTDETKWYPRWKSKATETLWLDYWEAGRLYWRVVKRHRKK